MLDVLQSYCASVRNLPGFNIVLEDAYKMRQSPDASDSRAITSKLCSTAKLRVFPPQKRDAIALQRSSISTFDYKEGRRMN